MEFDSCANISHLVNVANIVLPSKSYHRALTLDPAVTNLHI